MTAPDGAQPIDPGRARFLAACVQLLGHHYPASDRELALAALAVACARTPGDAPLDEALRAFVPAIAPLVGAPDAEAAARRIGAVEMRGVKRSALSHALAVGPAIVCIDASREDVLGVPPPHAGRRDLRLRLGYDLHPAIPDLELGDSGWTATLRFGAASARVVIPWDAVWGVGSEVSHDGVVWNPPEGWNAPDAEPDAPARPKLGVIDGGLLETDRSSYDARIGSAPRLDADVSVGSVSADEDAEPTSA